MNTRKTARRSFTKKVAKGTTKGLGKLAKGCGLWDRRRIGLDSHPRSVSETSSLGTQAAVIVCAASLATSGRKRPGPSKTGQRWRSAVLQKSPDLFLLVGPHVSPIDRWQDAVNPIPEADQSLIRLPISRQDLPKRLYVWKYLRHVLEAPL